MRIEQQKVGEEYWIRIHGILDFSTMDQLHEDWVIPDGTSKMVIDVTHMEFIDSTGIGGILNLLYSGSAKQLAIEIQGLREEVKEIFETLGVFQIMKALQAGGDRK